ncbi:hypothetical protein WT53_28565 [Burkholderia sp. MSMB2157WGS]|nr:hypothetical protein WT53_28565 [Burkholderia sp. MSMB2157WGS]
MFCSDICRVTGGDCATEAGRVETAQRVARFRWRCTDLQVSCSGAGMADDATGSRRCDPFERRSGTHEML